MPLVVVLAGGGPVDVAVVPTLPADAHVVAADAGALLAPSLGLAVHELVGDLDSLPADAAERLAGAGTVVHRHPTDKDQTDLELALDLAVGRGPAQVLVLAGGGGRFDHLLANALVLAAPRWAAVRIDAVFGDARVHVVREHLDLHGAPGDLVSLLAVDRPAEGVRTAGLRYALHGEALHPGSARGMSNELAAPAASVTVADGVLLAVRPGAAP